MSDLKNPNLGWQSLVRYCLVMSVALAYFNCWFAVALFPNGISIELAGAWIGAGASFFALISSILSSRNNCNPSHVVQTYACFILAFGLSVTLFSLVAHTIAAPESQWIFVNFVFCYLAVYLLAILFSTYYLSHNEKAKNYFAILRSRLEQEPTAPIVRPSGNPRNANSASAIIFCIGAVAAVVGSLVLGRAAGMLYTAFLSSLILGPTLLVFWLLNVMQRRAHQIGLNKTNE